MKEGGIVVSYSKYSNQMITSVRKLDLPPQMCPNKNEKMQPATTSLFKTVPWKGRTEGWKDRTGRGERVISGSSFQSRL